MLDNGHDILTMGDESGNGMTVRFNLPSGIEIFGLPTKNTYGGQWDLGPTWNYLVRIDRPFLVDSGRFGQGRNLIEMMNSVGQKPEELDAVLVSHGHEDHDGGIFELARLNGVKIRAHWVYQRLIAMYPDRAPAEDKKDFPAKCWHCVMPESFYRPNCLEYHRCLQDIRIEALNDGQNQLYPEVRTLHLPGHSPDCMAVLIGDEALIVGDIVLPDITPWPTREAMFEVVAGVLGPEAQALKLFGLRRFIKSLKKLGQLAQDHPNLLVLPAHRLYYKARWNGIDLAEKVKELLGHHVNRCAAILEILKTGPKTVEEIVKLHFEERLLKGFGSIMAAGEIISHNELLMACGDLVKIPDEKFQATGSGNFEKWILG